MPLIVGTGIALLLMIAGVDRLVRDNALRFGARLAVVEMDELSSKLAPLPPADRAQEAIPLVAARVLEASIARGADCRTAARDGLLVSLRLADGHGYGTPGLDWRAVVGSAPDGMIRFDVPRSVACATARLPAIGIVRTIPGARLMVGWLARPDERLRTGSLLIGGGAFVVFAGLAIVLARGHARRLIARVAALSAVLDHADRSGFAVRASVDGGDPDFDRLGRDINALLERVSDLLDGLGRLHAHVAHDLRSPLLVARKRLDAVRAGMGTLAEVDERLAALDRRCMGLLNIIKAETAAGHRFETMRLDARLQALVDGMIVYLADERSLALSIAAVPVAIVGQPDLIDRMIENILVNAVKFADVGSTIAITLDRHGGRARLVVENDGPVVSADRIERIFAPGVAASDADGGGHGFGLPFVRAAATRHGGTAVATVSGARFRMTVLLPLATRQTP